jgi:hyperosmotically inducible protein
MKARFIAAWVFVLAALLPGVPARAQDRDMQIGKAVADSLVGYVRLTIFDHVNAQVEQGVVTLSGRVTMPYKKDEVEKRVGGIAGVVGVHSDIAVLPVSSSDDELRYRVARAIYGNPSFWSYAAMPNPPIHIIVEHGRVTLAGVVNNNVERTLARSLATGLGEVSVTNELKTDAEVRSN